MQTKIESGLTSAHKSAQAEKPVRGHGAVKAEKKLQGKEEEEKACDRKDTQSKHGWERAKSRRRWAQNQ